MNQRTRRKPSRPSPLEMTTEEAHAYMAERQVRRYPGYRRAVAEREAKLFSAAVRAHKRATTLKKEKP